MAEPTDAPAGLADAAAALHAELAEYERLAVALEGEPLTSAKQLGRAARQLEVLAESERRLEGLGRALVAAVSTARSRQERLSASVVARAGEIRTRTGHLQQLLGRWETLGAAAGEVNRKTQATLGEGREGNGGGVGAAAQEIAAELDRLAAEAAALGEEATAADFGDLAREATELRRSLRAATGRLRALGGDDAA